MVRAFSVAGVFVLAAAAAQAQTPAAPKPGAAADEGIPIRNEVVRAKCGSCHRSDDQMRMSRISYRRATPENWERTIKRMVVLNHATLEPADARTILKYLADHLGLAPEEERPIAFEAERRMVDYTYNEDKDTSDTCSSCHSLARVLSERRTKEEWGLLRRDAPRLLPARRQPADERRPGLPAVRGRCRPSRRRRPSAGQPPSDGQGARAPHQDAAAEHLGVGRLVRGDAAAEAGRTLGADRDRCWARARSTAR